MNEHQSTRGGSTPRPASLATPESVFELAALRLHLVVGMAAADERMDGDEVAALRAFVDRCSDDEPHRSQLHAMLDRLIESPPVLQDLLRSLVGQARPALAELLVEDLAFLARSDGHVDPREEGLLRLVCGALEVDPVSLYPEHERAAADVSAADLSRLVRDLIGLDPAD